MSFLKVKNPIKFDNEVTISNNLIITGNVDGRDISVDGSTLDTHVADSTLHRVINDTGTSTTELWSSNKISTELSNKSNTSHTHVVTDITDFSTGVDTRISLQKGTANGIATLDGSSKILLSQLPAIAITNVTVVANIAARDALTPNEGDVSKVTDSGAGYPQTYIYDGSVWIDIQETSDVISVNGSTGVVSLNSDNISEGSTNLYYTEARVNANSNVTANTNHISNTSNPHSVTKAQVGLSDVQNIKSNFSATTAPTTTDDFSAGYVVGSIWVDVTNDISYICVDSTNSSAVWVSSGSTTNIVSVNGYTGTVALDSDDINEGVSNLYYTESRVNSNSNVSLNTSHRSLTNNPHSVTATQVGLSNVQNLKVNLAASINPSISNDTSDGYSIGSTWINTLTDTIFVCTDSTNSAAKWIKINDDEDDYTEYFTDFITSEIPLDLVCDTSGINSDITIEDAIGGQVKLLSGNLTTNFSQLSFSNKFIDKSVNSCIKTRIKLSSITQTKVEIGSIIDANNLARFIYNVTTSGSNWYAETISGGTNTIVDTTIPATTGWILLEIQYENTEIRFYINNVLKNTISSNLPSGLMNMYIKQTSNTTTSMNTLCDFIKITGNRET